jgi:polyhydroxybutyrate depolymerase
MPASLLEGRPYDIMVPAKHAAQAPLVVVLHGYSSNGLRQAEYLHLPELVEEKGFYLAMPSGTRDPKGYRFWNATDACCNFWQAPVDDVGYLRAVIEDARQRYPIDAKRIFVVGHSNGGFMAHRVACDLSLRVAAIVSLAGPMVRDPARCVPVAPVSVLHIQGDADASIHLAGGVIGDGAPPYPGTRDTVQAWARKNGCAAKTSLAGAPLDLDDAAEGLETSRERFDACPRSGEVELWMMHGSGHEPHVSTDFARAIWEFLEAHPKP